MAVWPFLLMGYCLTAVYNLRAGAAFILCLIAIQFVKRMAFAFDQLLYCAIYSCIAAVVFFFFDRLAGVAFCLCGLVYALHVGGLVDHRPKMVIAEVFLLLGMIASAYNGPSGGYMARDGSIYARGFNHIDPWLSHVFTGASLRR